MPLVGRKIRKDGFDKHEKVLPAKTDDGSHILLGGAHRSISVIFYFTIVTEKVVNMDRVNDMALIRMVQFYEPVSSEWQTVAQNKLFAHFLEKCEPNMNANAILEDLLVRNRNEGMDM